MDGATINAAMAVDVTPVAATGKAGGMGKAGGTEAVVTKMIASEQARQPKKPPASDPGAFVFESFSVSDARAEAASVLFWVCLCAGLYCCG